jgi:hypothetical protein
MKFTQFLRPNGERKTIESDPLPDAIEAMASELAGAGWEFQCELLRTGHVHADCCNRDGQLASFVKENDEQMIHAVVTLVREAYSNWTKLGKPSAAGFTFPEAE